MKRTFRTLLLALLLCGLPALSLASPVNINTADAATLAAALKGVGPVKARAIVAYRKAHGAFHSVDDLAKVKGIGPVTIKKNRQDIQLGPVSKGKP